MNISVSGNTPVTLNLSEKLSQSIIKGSSIISCANSLETRAIAADLVQVQELENNLKGEIQPLKKKVGLLNDNLKSGAFWVLGIFTLFIPQIIFIIERALIQGKLKNLDTKVLQAGSKIDALKKNLARAQAKVKALLDKKQANNTTARKEVSATLNLSPSPDSAPQVVRSGEGANNKKGDDDIDLKKSKQQRDKEAAKTKYQDNAKFHLDRKEKEFNEQYSEVRRQQIALGQKLQSITKTLIASEELKALQKTKKPGIFKNFKGGIISAGKITVNGVATVGGAAARVAVGTGRAIATVGGAVVRTAVGTGRGAATVGGAAAQAAVGTGRGAVRVVLGVRNFFDTRRISNAAAAQAAAQAAAEQEAAAAALQVAEQEAAAQAVVEAAAQEAAAQAVVDAAAQAAAEQEAAAAAQAAAAQAAAEQEAAAAAAQAVVDAAAQEAAAQAAAAVVAVPVAPLQEQGNVGVIGRIVAVAQDALHAGAVVTRAFVEENAAAMLVAGGVGLLFGPDAANAYLREVPEQRRRDLP